MVSEPEVILETKDKKFKDFCELIIKKPVNYKSIVRDLNFIKKWDSRTVYIHTGTLYQETIAPVCMMAEQILKNSSLYVRFLTDSILLYDVAERLRAYSAKVFF